MLPDYVTRLRKKDIAKREKRERKNGTIKHEPLVEKCKSNLPFSSDYHLSICSRRQNVQIPTSIERPDNTPAGSSNTRPAAIVSNGRGDYPTIELVSVQRHHTHPGHGPPARRNMYEHTDVKARTLNRISRRLADVRQHLTSSQSIADSPCQ